MQNVENGVRKIEVSLATDRGCQRDRNEDHILFFEPDDPSLLEKKGILAIVADGMGGHRAGEVASELAVKLIKQGYYHEPGEPSLALAAAFQTANREIYKLSRSHQAYRGMGTTCTALVLQEASAYCAHVGDSRLYLLRDNKLMRMTEDHSMVMEMVKSGIITAEEARHHPDKNILARALGVKPKVEVSIWDKPFQVQKGDVFILCSDGLYDLVKDDEIEQIAQAHDPSQACDKLINLAKERGGCDNISVGLLRIRRDP